MSTLAVIGTFYRRPWAIPRIAEALRSQERQPDELWLMFEDEADGEALFDVEDWGIDSLDVQVVPVAFGIKPGITPFAYAITTALDLTNADYITYLTDDSLPDPYKYAIMAASLNEHPEWGAVYCSQDFGQASGPEDWLAGGRHDGIRRADAPQAAPFCQVDHTQVMHRRTPDRWPLEPQHRQTADGVFFRDLVARLGPLQPVPEVLDWTRQLPGGVSSR